MKTIASLNLLESGNVEVKNLSFEFMKIESVIRERFMCVSVYWNNPELQALLDKFIEADKGGM